MLSAILKRCMAASRCQGTIRFWKGQELTELTAMFDVEAAHNYPSLAPQVPCREQQ